MIKRWCLLALCSLPLWGVIVYLALIRPRPANVTRVLADKTIAGNRLLLTQTYRGLDGNETLFVVKDKKNIWRSYYIEHEDTYWHNANFNFVSEGVEIRRGTHVVAFYQPQSRRYYLTGSGIQTEIRASTVPFYSGQSGDVLQR